MRRLVATSKQVTQAVLIAFTLFSPALAQNAPTEAGPEPKPARLILVSIPDRKLALIADGRTLKVYPVAVGAPQSPSPEGEFKVVNRVENPTFYRPGTVIEPGPENPLGSRWIGLSRKGYGIHGTNVPSSIGKAASHGCIRMRQQDLEELFTLLREGDVVAIRAERDDELAKALAAEPVVTAQAQDGGVTAEAEAEAAK